MDLQLDSSGKINKIYLYILWATGTKIVAICKCAEGVLDPSVYVIDEDIKQHWFRYRPLRGTTHDWFPSGHWAIDPLDVTIKPIPHPPDSPAMTFISPI